MLSKLCFCLRKNISGGGDMTWVHALFKPEPVALIVLLVLLVSLVQGMRRGASGSALHLFFFVWQAVSIVLSLIVAGKMAVRLSPVV
jgi:hypothetical protein